MSASGLAGSRVEASRAGNDLRAALAERGALAPEAHDAELRSLIEGAVAAPV